MQEGKMFRWVQVSEVVPYKGGAWAVTPGAQAGACHPPQPTGRHGPGALCGVGCGPQKPHSVHSGS